MYTDHQLAVIEAAREEADETHSVRTAGIRYIYFWSYSRGRGKRRHTPKIIELIYYAGRCYQWNKCPFDTISTEVYGYSDNTVEERLKLEVRQYG